MAFSVRPRLPLAAAPLLHVGALLVLAARLPLPVAAEPQLAASAADSSCPEPGGGGDSEDLMEVTLMQRASVLESAKKSADKLAVVDGHQSRGGGRISLYGVETRDNRSSIPCAGVPGWSFRNLGAHRPWEGWRGRTELYLEELIAVSKEDPERLVILSDVSDVMFGGCSETELLNYYYDVVAHSDGAAVVHGAEVKLFPYREWQMLGYEVLRDRRKAVQAASGVGATDYCPDNEMRIKSKSPGYGFLNGGFIMGPAKKVSKALEGWLALPAELCTDDTGSWNDQMAASSYMLRHPSEVTLDYSGRVVLQHSSLMYACLGMKFIVEVKDKRLINNVTKTTACFVHGNANANHKPEWITMEKALRHANT